MTENTERLPKEPVGDLEPTQVTDTDAAAIRGGTGASFEFATFAQTVNSTVKDIGEALSQLARKA